MHPTPPDPLVATLLDRLRDEEALLRDTLAVLTDLHAALRGGDLAAVAVLNPRQDAIGAALAAHHQKRTSAAYALAAVVGLSAHGLTLSALAARLPASAAADVRAARDRLAPLAAAVTDTQRRNATLMRNLRSYFRDVLSALAGDPAPSSRYGRTGTCLPAAGGVAIQARG